MARRSVIAVTVAVVTLSAGILLYVASIGGFDPSNRVITDDPEGTVTAQVENPAPPELPSFPPAGNLSSGNVSG